ncbi:MAG: hypothetical protein RIR91_720 [Verrucomicrobiota bacterium]|jgi:hypothetical protein
MHLTKAVNFYPKPNGTKADERLTVSSAIVQFATTWDITTQYIVIDVQDADVMVTFDGSSPSATNGHRLYAGSNVIWSRQAAAAAKFIRQGGTDAAVHASQFTD